MNDTREYRAIARFYGNRTTRRSGVPLIRHIDHGLVILDRIAATDAASRAFCLHPLVQDGVADAATLTDDGHVVVLANAYRDVANAALSSRELASATDIALSELPEVNQMLVADKVQNRLDFLRHHRASHPRGDSLDRYFALWLERLEIDHARFAELTLGL